MSVDGSGNPLAQWYQNRIGHAETDDEIWGYWLFATGVVLGIIGIGLLVVGDLEGPVPQWPVVVSAIALVFLVAGPLIRLPLRRSATWLVYVGAILALAAVPWFATAYPGWRPQATMIIGLYALGLLVMAIGGVFVPILTGGRELEQERDRQREAERTRQDEEIEELRAALADAEADEGDLGARLRDLQNSQGRFELYADKADEWRWRLRHRNGNVIANSGEGYTRKHNAQKGMQSVRRNALGATMMLLERDELPEPEEAFEPVEEVQSRATFEQYEDKAGEHRWRLRHDNGNIIADGGQGYNSRGGLERAIDSVREYVGPAAYLRFDPTGFEVYKDAAEEWRWRLVHKNGNILADSGEGYTRSNDARRAAARVRDDLDSLEFEIYEDSAGEFRWRLRGGNNQIVADSGEGYGSRSGAEDAVGRIEGHAPEADILEIGRAAFEVYEDAGGEWRWRLRARNGNIVADSGEGYTGRSDAHDAIESVKRNAPNAEEEAV